MNTINPKYTRNIDSTVYNNETKTNYLYNKPNVNLITNSTSTTKSNGNALKLYKKVDEDPKVNQVSPLIRILSPVYRLIRRVVVNNGLWN